MADIIVFSVISNTWFIALVVIKPAQCKLSSELELTSRTATNTPVQLLIRIFVFALVWTALKRTVLSVTETFGV